MHNRGSREVDAGDLPSLCHDIPGTWFRPSKAIALWQGDITRLGADAIVNAANAQLLGCFQPFHACIDNAIHWAAGPRLREDCGRIMAAQGHPEATGLAKITRAYRPAVALRSPHGRTDRSGRPHGGAPSRSRSLLSILPRGRGRSREHSNAGVLRDSDGSIGLPETAAADIAINTVAAWMQERPNTFSKVIFNVFSDDDRAAYTAALTRRTS